MINPTDGTKVAPHGMFYMEDAGGYHSRPLRIDSMHLKNMLR